MAQEPSVTLTPIPLLLVILGLVLSSCLPAQKQGAVAGAAAARPTVAWEFDGCTSDGITSVDVYLIINGDLHMVADDGTAEYRELNPGEGKRWGIPADRVTACAAGPAGAEDVLYVADEGGKFGVYRKSRRADAASFKRIKTISY